MMFILEIEAHIKPRRNQFCDEDINLLNLDANSIES